MEKNVGKHFAVLPQQNILKEALDVDYYKSLLNAQSGNYVNFMSFFT
jgi:hypothetical protein